MPDIDPLSLSLAAAQTGIGLFQSLFSGKNKAQKDLENTANNSPIYNGSRPISDYYNQALSRYNVSPYQSAQYQMAQQNAQRGTSSGINALQNYGYGGALGGIGKLVGLQNSATNQAGVQAEQQRNQRFGQLGNATQMKAGDDRFAFQNNQVNPYNRRLQLQMMKAGAANARFDAGLTNAYTGLGNAAMLSSGMKKNIGYKSPIDTSYLSNSLGE